MLLLYCLFCKGRIRIGGCEAAVKSLQIFNFFLLTSRIWSRLPPTFSLVGSNPVYLPIACLATTSKQDTDSYFYGCRRRRIPHEIMLLRTATNHPHVVVPDPISTTTVQLQPMDAEISMYYKIMIQRTYQLSTESVYQRHRVSRLLSAFKVTSRIASFIFLSKIKNFNLWETK